jgi:hypothetical protein
LVDVLANTFHLKGEKSFYKESQGCRGREALFFGSCRQKAESNIKTRKAGLPDGIFSNPKSKSG